MPKDFEVKDATMLWAPAKSIMDTANWFLVHLQTTDNKGPEGERVSP